MQVSQEWIPAKNKHSKAQNDRLTFEDCPNVTMSLHATLEVWREGCRARRSHITNDFRCNIGITKTMTVSEGLYNSEYRICDAKMERYCTAIVATALYFVTM